MFVTSCSMWIYRKAGSWKIDNQRLSIHLYLMLALSLFNFEANGQDSTNHFSSREKKEIISSSIDIDFFTTFAGITVKNGETSNDRNSLYLYYNLSANNKLKAGKVVMTNYYCSEFGIKTFFDSISLISDDQYTFRNTISYNIKKSKFAFNFSISSKSQYFNHYNYREDSAGKTIKYLFTSYLSPGYSNYTGGIKFEFDNNCSIELGLVNGRNTKIKNQELFESRQSAKLYGLSKGNTKKMEFGFNLIVSIPTHQIFKNFYIENFSQLNIEKDKLSELKKYKVDINNAFHYKLLKHFRLTLRTKYLYDINVSDKPKIINNFTLGFYLNNAF